MYYTFLGYANILVEVPCLIDMATKTGFTVFITKFYYIFV